MKNMREKLSERFRRIQNMRHARAVIVSLAAVVVFVTTYLLILPALTLDEDEAQRQGGISLTTEAPAEEAAQGTEVTPTADQTAPSYKSGELTYEGKTFDVEATVTENAKLPADTQLKVKEIEKDNKDYASYYEEALKAVKEDADIKASDLSFARFYDIALRSGGQDIEPADAVDVTISYEKGIAAADADHVRIIHFKEDPKTDKVESEILKSDDVDVTIEKDKMTEASFEVESFSVYAVVYTVDFVYEADGTVHSFSLKGGDSISIRELAQQLAMAQGDAALNEFIDHIEKVSFSDETLVKPVRFEKDSSVGKVKTKLKLFPTYPLGLSQEEVLALNAKEYEKGEWVLISMKPFETEELMTIELDNGEKVQVKVTDAQDAPMNPDGETVQTISNPAGTTIDLFDYWIVSQELAGRDGWGDLNQSWGGHDDTEGDNGNNLNGSGNNKGINSSTEDEDHGHALKFSPAWDGSVYNGTKIGTHRYYPDWESGDHETHYDEEEPWRSLNRNGKDGLNSYTGNATPFQGIVSGKLVNGYPQLTKNQTIGSSGESLAYLFDTGSEHTGKASYNSVNQLLYVDKDGYYTYDSRDYTATYNSDKTFTLREQTSSDTEIRGFWPFGTQSFWFGMHMNTQFSMPVNGQVLNPAGEYKDMQFEFSGDDDTWLYVDGVLVGDGGGIHNRTEIDINFADGTVVVTGEKDPAHESHFHQTQYLDDIFKAAGKYPEEGSAEEQAAWEDIPGVKGHKRFKAGTYHTFDMFYLERGGGESNLYIHYNLVSTADFTAHKAYYGADESDLLVRNQFKFEMIGLDGKYRSVKNEETGKYELIPAEGGSEINAIMPAGGSITGDGTVESPYYNNVTNYTLSNGTTVGAQTYMTSASEDGNVNFGSAVISEEDMNEADQGNPPVYKYIIREIVPNDAVNSDGITWADATDAQREAGGFVKDQVQYDGTVYYMTGRVTSWTETDPSGNEVVRHGLSKTYYTDDTYKTVKSDVTFIDFQNRFTADYGKVSFIKEDSGEEPLSGAVFTLFKDENCTVPATDLDTEGHPVYSATSGANGKVTFDHIRVGTYYMKETRAPEEYELLDTIYKVTIVDEKDQTQASSIIVKGDDAQTPVSVIINTKISAEGLEVDKHWKGGTPADDTTIVYQLYQKAKKKARGHHALDVSQLGYGKPDWNAGRYFTNEELTGDKDSINVGTVVDVVITTTSWGDDGIWSFDTLNETTVITSNQTIVSDKLSMTPDERARQRTIRISVTDEEDHSIKLFGQLESCYEGNGGKPTISATIVSEPPAEDAENKLVGTVTLGKNAVNSIIADDFEQLEPHVEIEEGSDPWTSVIKNLPTSFEDNGWIYTYTYYVEEDLTSIPEGYRLEGIHPNYAVPGETIVIVNANEDAGYELPSTGGPGTRLIYLLGAILTIGAGLWLTIRRRRLT